MTRRSYAHIAVLVAAFLFAPVAREAQPQDSPSAEEREHAAAWGAHHLCAGLFVVRRDYQRDPDTVIGQDIAPFPAFRWEESFQYGRDPVHASRRPVQPARSR